MSSMGVVSEENLYKAYPTYRVNQNSKFMWVWQPISFKVSSMFERWGLTHYGIFLHRMMHHSWIVKWSVLGALTMNALASRPWSHLTFSKSMGELWRDLNTSWCRELLAFTNLISKLFSKPTIQFPALFTHSCFMSQSLPRWMQGLPGWRFSSGIHSLMTSIFRMWLACRKSWLLPCM